MHLRSAHVASKFQSGRQNLSGVRRLLLQGRVVQRFAADAACRDPALVQRNVSLESRNLVVAHVLADLTPKLFDALVRAVLLKLVQQA